MKKLPTRELIRLAMHYAIQDRDGMASAGAGAYSDDARELSSRFRAYLAERYGERPAADADADLPRISLHDLARAASTEMPE